jgi:hypothetical protein
MANIETVGGLTAAVNADVIFYYKFRRDYETLEASV